MKRESHAAIARHVLSELSVKHSSLVSSNLPVGRRYALLQSFPTKDKPLQHRLHCVASICGSSSYSSSARRPPHSTALPPVATSALEVNSLFLVKVPARHMRVEGLALHPATKTTAAVRVQAECSSRVSHRSYFQRELIKTRTAPSASPTKGASSVALGGLPWSGCRICTSGLSLMPLRMAAAAAWTATVATAAAAVPVSTRTTALRTRTTAALLLPPLLLSTYCRAVFADPVARGSLMHSQAAFLPAISIAALSLTFSSQPPVDFAKQSGSVAARLQPWCANEVAGRCPDARRKSSNRDTQCSKSGGLLHLLRSRSDYMSFSLENLAPFSSWTAAVASSRPIYGRYKNSKIMAGAGIEPPTPPSPNRGSREVCCAAESSAAQEEHEAFLSPARHRTSFPLFEGRSNQDRRAQNCIGEAGENPTSCCAAEPSYRTTAGAMRPLFALASSTDDGVKRQEKPGAVAPAAGDHFYARFRQPSHSAFDLVWQEPVPEMQLHVAYYVHKKTGARLMSLVSAPQEKEKVFCVSFSTPVSDSTGVPHILEHSVLAGSKKYPVKEPFAELFKGSLYSFLNAFTYAEHTSYPVASINTKDFYNLASVYFDAVLQPRVLYDIDVFRQEGWRVEATMTESENASIENVGLAGGQQKKEAREGMETGAETEKREDAQGAGKDLTGAAASSDSASAVAGESALAQRVKLSFQGVVLNEMKGVYSQPSWLLYRLRMKTIFPRISAYAQDSGGNPEVITSLTYEQFKAFYKHHYTPANARIFFWGSDDVSKRLEFIDKNLSELEDVYADLSADATTRIREQPAFHEPVRVRQPYPATTAEMEDYVTLTWVLDPAATREGSGAAKNGRMARVLSATDRLALTVLDYLLMGTSAAPLYKALASSQIGKEVVGGGHSEYKHVIFSAGLKGIPQEPSAAMAAAGAYAHDVEGVVNESAVDRVEKVILDTLEKCASDGFEPDAVAAAMNTIEFRLREFNTGSFPKGLSIILQIVSDWMVDREPLLSLKFEQPLQDMKRRLKEGKPVFQDLIRKLFLENPHRATVHLVADATLEKELQQKDEMRVETLRRTLSEAAVEELVKETKELKAKQLAPDPPEALATIPTLELTDVEEEEEIPTTAYSLADNAAQLLVHKLPTAGILYADVLLPLHKLDVEELQCMSLFARMLTQAGTSELDEAGLANTIGMHTGGLQATVDIRNVAAKPLHVPDPYDSVGFLVVSGKAVKAKVPELYEIIALVVRDADFGNSARGIEILKEIETSTSDSFINSGILAALRIGASLTAAGYIAEQRGGIPYSQFIRQQLAQAQQDWGPIRKKLEGMRQKLLSAAERQTAAAGGGGKEGRVMAFISLTGDSETLDHATSLQYSGGRKLRRLAKLMTVPLSRTAAEGAAQLQELGMEGEKKQFEHKEGKKRITRPSALIGEVDATDLGSLEKVENKQAGGRVVPPCAWATVVQEKSGLKEWPTAPEGFVIPTQVLQCG